VNSGTTIRSRFAATAADAGGRLGRLLSRAPDAAGLAFSRTRLEAHSCRLRRNWVVRE
jgi:hypothetical protein